MGQERTQQSRLAKLISPPKVGKSAMSNDSSSKNRFLLMNAEVCILCHDFQYGELHRPGGQWFITYILTQASLIGKGTAVSSHGTIHHKA
jgi:hypothetical protein